MSDIEKHLDQKLEQSKKILKEAIEHWNPTHIVSMVSGGKDSACSQKVFEEIAEDLNTTADLIIHGQTGCGIPETTEFVKEHYSNRGPELVIADAGTAYEDYVLRKGFFGKGIAAHGFSYRILKAGPFRKAVSQHIRKNKRNIRVLFINGARQDESENRRKNLNPFRPDPSQPNNIWVSIIYDWTGHDRDMYLNSRNVTINPVAKSLCRSGECFCGTVQTKEERMEASILFPEWGKWLDDLEAEVKEKHGFGWGDQFKAPIVYPEQLQEHFQPMCKDCVTDKEINKVSKTRNDD